jgi:hypothetical protein
MALYPGMPNPKCDVELYDGRGKSTWGLKLDQGAKSINESASTSDSMAVVMRDVGKKIGDFDEQLDWSSGRGKEYLSLDPSGYYDARFAWTLTPQKIMPVPEWFYATGYRNQDGVLYGSLSYMALFPGAPAYRYISSSFSASASYNADRCQLWIRRRGTPGTLTFELCQNNAGSPGTVLQTVTVDTTTITDVLAVLYSFNWTGTQALISGTTYHIKVYGASTDNAANHWDIGTSLSQQVGRTSSDNSAWNSGLFGILFRMVDADVDQRWFFYNREGIMYIVSKPASGTSVQYQWNPAAWKFDTQILAATSGLSIVTDWPCVSNDVVFFPQGESTNARAWTGSVWSDDGTNKYSFLINLSDSTTGSQVLRANTATGSASSISYAPLANPHVFGTAINVGDTSTPITGIVNFNNVAHIFKSDGMFECTATGKFAAPYDTGMSKTPSARNGLASAVQADFLYYSWGNSLMRLYSYNNNLDDVGQAWKGEGLPGNRMGNFSFLLPVLGWLFGAVDAGASGYSSVQCFTGTAWHEIFRAPELGKRIRGLWWQWVEGARPRLWIDMGGDLIYMYFPMDVASPAKDTGITFFHEWVATSATIDMTTATKLPKYIKELTILSDGLTDRVNNRSGSQIYLDVQFDDDVGKDGYAYWTEVGTAFNSPSSVIGINQGNVMKFRYRLRAYTADNTAAPIVTNVTPSGFARSPFRRLWNLRILTGEILRDGSLVSSVDLNKWLLQAAKFPGRITMTSVHPALHDANGIFVLVSPPNIIPTQPETSTSKSKTVDTLSIMEV